MFFLPLPLEKTLKTIDEVHNNESYEGSVGLPDPEFYIIVNGKASKNKILWQSVVNVEHVKAAVEKLREINWLYADVEDSSIDDTSRRVIDTTSQMLVKLVQRMLNYSRPTLSGDLIRSSQA